MTMKGRYSFRFEECDVTVWEANARDAGLSLSEWIRRRCNELNPVYSGTEKQGVREGGASKRKARPLAEAGSGNTLHDDNPKSYDTASYVSAENPATVCAHGFTGRKCQTWGCVNYEFAR